MMTNKLVQYVDEFLQCWKRARVVHSSHLVMHDMVEGVDICWRKIGLGKLKCNVNEATFVNNGCMGWAAVLRNDKDIGFVHKDCVTIASAFQSFQLCWFRRDANKVAYVLARGA
ncbi:hypothetical protein Gotri_010304 [Gossypium trilobum]|uniref:RNase H type-1 domain-containing protein n=1 Tax=Gossypium trilobum TaxID=34281 RepID=A0A7J9EQ67_9ROSI|nr:hypothetical protein [Gossypium trilobum]